NVLPQPRHVVRLAVSLGSCRRESRGDNVEVQFLLRRHPLFHPPGNRVAKPAVPGASIKPRGFRFVLPVFLFCCRTPPGYNLKLTLGQVPAKNVEASTLQSEAKSTVRPDYHTAAPRKQWKLALKYTHGPGKRTYAGTTARAGGPFARTGEEPP